MYRVPRTSVNTSSAEDSNETNSGCNNDDSDSETQQLLESLSQGQTLSFSCTDSHPLFNQNHRNAQLPKKGIIKLILNLVVLSLIAPFYLVKKACSTSSRESWSQKIVSWTTLFLLFFGASYLGLFDGSRFQQFGDKWIDFSVCDFILGEAEDLRSLIKATHVLERKAHEIPPLKEELEKLQSQLHVLSSDLKGIAHHAVSEVLESYISKGITTWSVEKMLKKLMDRLDEDDVQMPDYALKSAVPDVSPAAMTGIFRGVAPRDRDLSVSQCGKVLAGASIVQSRTTRSYHHQGGKYFWRSLVMLPFVKSPDVILQPDNVPGNCWSFPGNQGETVIQLAMGIIPTAFTINHISKKVSPNGEISSAPRDFAVYGLKEEMEQEGTFLGQFVFNAEGDLVQTFHPKVKSSELIGYVKLKVLSNWGHPNYTCIYRFRVHGEPEKI